MIRYVDIETYDGIKNSATKKGELDTLFLHKDKPNVPYYLVEIKIKYTEKLYAHERSDLL